MSPPLPSDIDFSVARDGELPIGTQLVWKLRSLIESGALEPGDRLPSVRTMAEAAGVNVNTARSVYGRLEHAGLIRSEHGRGTFVTPQAPINSAGEPTSRPISADTMKMPEPIIDPITNIVELVRPSTWTSFLS